MGDIKSLSESCGSFPGHSGAICFCRFSEELSFPAACSTAVPLRELGIRVALGAGQQEVLRAALGRAFRLLAIGPVAGIVLGVLATKVLSYIVYQATPKDPLVLGGVVITMLALSLVAAWIPARRALAVDPMILLREE